MGFKSLSLQLLPWCVHLVGGTCISSSGSSPTPTLSHQTSRIILCCDGRMKVYHHPVTAAELMKEYPLHLVCRSDDCFIGQKVPPLAAGDQLQPGHSYFLLPSHLFHSVLSFVALAATLNNMMMLSTKGQQQMQRPFDIHRTASGTLQIRVSDEFVVQKAKEEMAKESGRSRVVTSEALEKEYKALVLYRKPGQWKPKLESINEYITTMTRSPSHRRLEGVVKQFRSGIRLIKSRKKEIIDDGL